MQKFRKLGTDHVNNIDSLQKQLLVEIKLQMNRNSHWELFRKIYHFKILSNSLKNTSEGLHFLVG